MELKTGQDKMENVMEFTMSIWKYFVATLKLFFSPPIFSSPFKIEISLAASSVVTSKSVLYNRSTNNHPS